MAPKPPEKIVLLRHRAARINEVWKAYQIFWDRQIPVGEALTCSNEENASNITHTLLIVYLSYIYSMFDDSACHFIADTEAALSDFTPLALEARDHVIQLWKILANPLQRLRHNTGFHGGKTHKSLVDGYNQVNQRHINVAMADCMMLFMDVFFRELSSIYDFEENYLIPKNADYPKELLQIALDFEEAVLVRGFGNEVNLVFNDQLVPPPSTMPDPAAALLSTSQGVFLGKFIGPAADTLGDVAWKRIQQLSSQAHQFLVSVGREPQIIEPKVWVPLVQAASLESNPTLTEKWAALLANAADPAQRVRVQPGFAEVLRQLTPADAQVLELVYRRVRTDFSATLYTFELVETDGFAEALGLARLPFAVCVDTLIRLRLCEANGSNQVVPADPADQVPVAASVFPTAFGQQFLAACTPPVA